MAKKISYIVLITVIITFNQLCLAKELNTNSDKLENAFGIERNTSQYKNGLFLHNNNIYENPTYKRTQRLLNEIEENLEDYKKINKNHHENDTILTDYEKSLYKKANNLILQNKYKEALSVMDEIITLQPFDETALYIRGFIKYNLKDYKGSIYDFSSAINTKSPVFNDVYGFRAHCYMQLQQYEKAIDDYKKSMNHDPNDALDYVRKGLCYLKLGNKEQAIRDFFKAASLYDELDDEDTEAHDNLMEAIFLLSKDYKGKKQKIASIYPDINILFKSHYITKNGYYIYYIHPSKWGSLNYCDKINLIQETIFYSMFQELLKQRSPLYFLIEGDIKIRSSIDGTDLIERNPKRGKQENIFKDITLQEISKNFILTPAYLINDPVAQDEILNAYIKKVQAIFDCEMPNYRDGLYFRSFVLRVNRKGEIKSIALNSSPWIDKIDDNAVKVIRSLAPFPSIPVNYKQDYIEIPLMIRILPDNK